MQEESFVVKKVFGGKLRGRKQFIRRRFSLFVGNEKSMFKSRKMSEFIDEFILKESIYGINASRNVVI